MLVNSFHERKCSQELQETIDEPFLRELAKPYNEVDDDRVIKGLTELASTNIHILTLDPIRKESKVKIYQPLKPQLAVSTIHIGHIKDEHFVPSR